MKKFLLAIVIFLAAFSTFSQHFKGQWLAVEYIGTHEGIRYFWFSADNKYVYAFGQTEVIGFNVQTGEKIFKVKSNGSTVHWPSASKDGSKLLVGNYFENKNNDPDHGYMVPNLDEFDLKTKSWKKQSIGKEFLQNTTYSSNGKTAFGIQSLNAKASVIEFQISPFKKLKNLTPNETNEVLSYAIDEKKGIMAYSTLGSKSSLKIMDYRTGDVFHEMAQGKEISQLAITPDGKTLLAGSMYELYIIDLESYATKTLNVNKDESGMYVQYIDVHPNSRSVAICSRFGTALVDLKTLAIERISKSPSMGCNFSSDGQYLAFAVKSLGDKTPCMYIYHDPQFKGVNFEKEETTEMTIDSPMEEVKVKIYNYTCDQPAFSIETRDEPKESISTSKKGRKMVTVTSGNKIFATTLSAVELAPSFKPSKYEKLSQDVAESFVSKKEYELVKKETIDWHGSKGVRYLLKLKNLYYDYRVVTINGYNYQLIFIYDQKMDDLTIVNDYFNSFKLNK